MRKHISLITIFIGALIFFYETRHFYKIGDRTLTVWKTNSGCFVIPYSYYGILPPQKNYLKLSNIGTAYIFLVPKDSLYIFTRVRDKKRLEKVGNLVKNSYLYR